MNYEKQQKFDEHSLNLDFGQIIFLDQKNRELSVYYFYYMHTSIPQIQTNKKHSSHKNSFKIFHGHKNEQHQNKNKIDASHPYIRPKSIHRPHNKNYLQSHSTTSLANCNKNQQINNTESSGTNYSINVVEDPHKKNQVASNIENISNNINQDPNLAYLNLTTNKKANKVDLPESSPHHLHNKSATNISSNGYLRQTTQPNTSIRIPKHKQTDFIQKIQIYSKQAKSPVAVRLNFTQKEQEIKKSSQQTGLSPRFLNINKESPKKNRNSDNNQFQPNLRQTLDPHTEKFFPQYKKSKLSPSHFIKKRQTQHDFSHIIKQKTPKNVSHTTSLNQNGSFWRNKAVSPPSKPLSPKKVEIQQSSNFKIPPLSIPNYQKTPTHKPSFFMNKKSLSKFNIIKQLGSGTYSDVFLCMDKKTNAVFCLKRYLKSTLKNLPEALDNFIKKVAFQHLAQHPNIVQLYDIFSDGQFVCTIQQYMESGRLHDVIVKQTQQRQHKRRETQNLSNVSNVSKDSEEVLFSQSKIIDKIFDINSALCFIHQSSSTITPEHKMKMPALVHGDVKTKSILVNLGVCKLPTIEPMQLASNIINSYSPPEQIIEQVYIAKSDIWSLGLVLFQLCAQRRLFCNSQRLDDDHEEVGTKVGYQVFNVNITSQIQKLGSITQLLKQLIKKMLAIKPQDRPSSDVVMSSNVFRMYGFDTDWKQRRNCKSMKIQETLKHNVRNDLSSQCLETINQDSINFVSFRKISNESQGARTQGSTLTPQGNNVKISFQKKSNSQIEKQEVHVSNPAKQHWTSKMHSHNN